MVQTFLEGLFFLFDKKVCHRDLKPDNILVSKDFCCKFIDFGSACHNNSFRRGHTDKTMKRILPSQRKFYNM